MRKSRCNEAGRESMSPFWKSIHEWWDHGGMIFSTLKFLPEGSRSEDLRNKTPKLAMNGGKIG